MKFDIGEVLTRAWQITRRHKVLWTFGLLASIVNGGSGGNGNSKSNSDTSNFDSNGTATSFFDAQVNSVHYTFSEFILHFMLIIVTLCFVILILTFLFYSLGLMGRIGIIKSVYKVEGTAESIAFGNIWSESMSYFWRFFGLNFPFYLFSLGSLMLVIPFVILTMITYGIGLILLIPLLCILGPVRWIVLVILEQAQAAIVLENRGVVDSLRRGWGIAKSNLSEMIGMGLILGVGGVIVRVIIAWPITLVSIYLLPVVVTTTRIPIMPIILAPLLSLLSLPSLENISSVPSTVWVALACLTIYFPILLALNGILITYTKTAWALSYMRLANNPENQIVFYNE